MYIIGQGCIDALNSQVKSLTPLTALFTLAVVYICISYNLCKTVFPCHHYGDFVPKMIILFLLLTLKSYFYTQDQVGNVIISM